MGLRSKESRQVTRRGNSRLRPELPSLVYPSSHCKPNSLDLYLSGYSSQTCSHSFHNSSAIQHDGVPHSFSAFLRSYPSLPSVIVSFSSHRLLALLALTIASTTTGLPHCPNCWSSSRLRRRSLPRRPSSNFQRYLRLHPSFRLPRRQVTREYRSSSSKSYHRSRSSK